MAILPIGPDYSILAAGSAASESDGQKKLFVVTTNNPFNLKSNTMKNTVQRYSFYAI